MAAECLRVEEALEGLRLACASSLRRLQEGKVPGDFSFVDFWGKVRQDDSTHLPIPGLTQLSRFFDLKLPTWVDYFYEDGQLSAALVQDLGTHLKCIQRHDEINVEDIPFDQFSEEDLLAAAREIEAHLESTIEPTVEQ